MATVEGTLYTCISCAMKFLSADDQRDHYKSDFHRYNMKRRVTGLPPVDLQSYDVKVLERQGEEAISSVASKRCQDCRKNFSTIKSYDSHLQSKRHKDSISLGKTSPPKLRSGTPNANGTDALQSHKDAEPKTQLDYISGEPSPFTRTRIETLHCLCLFCPEINETAETNRAHITQRHGFFIPDSSYLIDLPGLLTYLNEKIRVQHVCLWCNRKSKQWKDTVAVQQHMVTKGHCKVPYDTTSDRLEISDYYDFRPSYENAPQREPRLQEVNESSDKRDDVELDEEADEWVDEETESVDEKGQSQVNYGDSLYELVLPSGARIGHRSLRRYYAQRFDNPLPNTTSFTNSETTIMKRLQSNRAPIIPACGADFGGAGKGMMIIKVNTVSRAKEAGRHIREFRDSHNRELYRTKIGLKSNNKKNFRDQLLQ